MGLVRRGSLRPPPLVQGGTFGTTQTTTSVLRARPNGGLGGSPEGNAAHTGAQQLARPARRPNRVVPSGPRAGDPRKAHCLVYDQPGCSADSPGGRGGVRRTTVRPPADLVFSRKLVCKHKGALVRVNLFALSRTRLYLAPSRVCKARAAELVLVHKCARTSEARSGP